MQWNVVFCMAIGVRAARASDTIIAPRKYDAAASTVRYTNAADPLAYITID